jgi:hypothetical protein
MALACEGMRLATLGLRWKETIRFQADREWARLGSNQRPLACEASALPLSYAPEECNLPENDRGLVSRGLEWSEVTLRRPCRGSNGPAEDLLFLLRRDAAVHD